MLDADSRVTLTDHADGIVVADAMRLVRADDVMAEEVYYIHADHLGTPRAVSDGAGHVVWRWESEPFGNTVPDEDPDGDGDSFRLNLRFPGQYFDGESGLYYNYFRYYDPATGRYITSDPVGLSGGLNTYGYVGGNPIRFADPLGLLPGDICGQCAPGDTHCLLYGGSQCFPRVDLGRDQFPVYGNWCGSGWTGGYEGSWDTLTPGQRNNSKNPIDALDSACKTHDICYTQCGKKYPCSPTKRSSCFLVECDKKLEKAAYRFGGINGNIIGRAIGRGGVRNPGPNSSSCGCSTP